MKLLAVLKDKVLILQEKYPCEAREIINES